MGRGKFTILCHILIVQARQQAAASTEALDGEEYRSEGVVINTLSACLITLAAQPF